MILNDLEKHKLIQPPSWLTSNVHYLTLVGSHAYGTNKKDSDQDIYGICIPRKEDLFPHLKGEIDGFGKQKQKFEQFIAHQLNYKNQEYDFTIFNIVKVFSLMMDGNPNCLEVLFTPQDCILHTTQIGQTIRENRHVFLSKICYPRYKGYSYSMLHKLKNKERTNPDRQKDIELYSYDTKFAMNCVRLLLQVEQILAEKDLDLRRHSEQLKSIRRGEWTEEEIIQWAGDKEKQLEKLYHESDLPWGPDESAIKDLLLSVLESHYGDLSSCIVRNENVYVEALKEIQQICSKVGI